MSAGAALPAGDQVGESAGMQGLVDVGQQDAGAVRRQGARGAGDGRGPALGVVGVVHRARGETVQRRAHVVGPMAGDHKHVA